MIYTTLGSGTLVPSSSRASAAHLVELDGATLLFDIGFGTVHGFARHGVDWPRISHVVLSHFHTDHIGDLAPYLFALTHGVPGGRSEPLVLVGPPGLGRVLDGLRQAHGDWVVAPPFPLQVVEVPRGGRWADPGHAFDLSSHGVPHTPEAVAWRLEAGGEVFGYSGDTGPDASLGAFMAGAGLFVCECAVPDGSDVAIHLSPSQVAEVARDAGPGLLVLTHSYPPLVPDELPHLVRTAGYHGPSVAGYDGARFAIRGGGASPAPTG